MLSVLILKGHIAWPSRYIGNPCKVESVRYAPRTWKKSQISNWLKTSLSFRPVPTDSLMVK